MCVCVSVAQGLANCWTNMVLLSSTLKHPGIKIPPKILFFILKLKLRHYWPLGALSLVTFKETNYRLLICKQTLLTLNWINLDYAIKNSLLFIPSVGPGYVDTRVRPWNARNARFVLFIYRARQCFVFMLLHSYMILQWIWNILGYYDRGKI